MKLLCALALALIVILLVGGAAQHAAGTTHASSDEAGSILASKEILSTGLPRVPSGKIYYRSLLPHYLTAASIGLVGDTPLGWRGASLLAYALLLFIPAWMLMQHGPPLLGPCWAFLVGSPLPMLNVAISGRMYMIYIFFAAMAAVLAVLWQPMRWNRQGWIYFAVCICAGLSHEHFVVFVPGLMLCALLAWIKSDVSFIRFCTGPALSPVYGLALAVLIHFSEPLIPNVFVNFSSGLRLMGAEPSSVYPLNILSQSPISALLVALLFLTFSRPSGSIGPTVILLTSYAAISVMLPAAYPYYVLPLWPVFLLAVFGLLIEENGWPLASKVSAAMLFVFAIGVEASIGQRADNLAASYSFLADPPVSYEKRWEQVRQFIQQTDATVITSDPEILLLNRIGPIAGHVRSLNVPAATPCSVVMDDYIPVPFVHHACQMDTILIEAKRKDIPVLFIGSRFDTIGLENAKYIRTSFQREGEIDGLDVFCSGERCQLLTPD